MNAAIEKSLQRLNIDLTRSLSDKAVTQYIDQYINKTPLTNNPKGNLESPS